MIGQSGLEGKGPLPCDVVAGAFNKFDLFDIYAIQCILGFGVLVFCFVFGGFLCVTALTVLELTL